VIEGGPRRAEARALGTLLLSADSFGLAIQDADRFEGSGPLSAATGDVLGSW